jgi:hypothetical protein
MPARAQQRGKSVFVTEIKSMIVRRLVLVFSIVFCGSLALIARGSRRWWPIASR